jgi:hypothetical protein
MGRRARRRSEGGESQPRLLRSGEQPGAVLKGPPITLTCECGEKRDLPYGERWQCDKCGRIWDTGLIPREQYDAIRKMSMRFRALPIGFGAFVAAVAIFFTLTGNVFSVFFLLPVALSVWFVFLRPIHRKRYRRAIADLPRWELHPE